MLTSERNKPGGGAMYYQQGKSLFVETPAIYKYKYVVMQTAMVSKLHWVKMLENKRHYPYRDSKCLDNGDIMQGLSEQNDHYKLLYHAE